MALLIKTSSRLHLDNTMVCMRMKYLWPRSSVLPDSRASLTWRWFLLRLKYWQQCRWTNVHRQIFLSIDSWLACFLTLHRKTYVVWSLCQLQYPFPLFLYIVGLSVHFFKPVETFYTSLIDDESKQIIGMCSFHLCVSFLYGNLYDCLFKLPLTLTFLWWAFSVLISPHWSFIVLNVFVLTVVTSQPSGNDHSLLSSVQPTLQPFTDHLNENKPHRLRHLVPSWHCCLGKLRKPLVKGTSLGSGIWECTASPHFRFSFCFLFEAMLPLHDRLLFPATISQKKSCVLWVALVVVFWNSNRKVACVSHL